MLPIHQESRCNVTSCSLVKKHCSSRFQDIRSLYIMLVSLDRAVLSCSVQPVPGTLNRIPVSVFVALVWGSHSLCILPEPIIP